MIYAELFISFAMIGFTSFGGLSMIPLINDQMLSHGWMTAQELADILAIAEMTPGPIGLNCATFAGARTAGTLGALCATVGVLTPALTTAVLVAIFMKRFKQSTLMQHALYGIRPICIGLTASVIINQSIVNYAGVGAGVSWVAIFIGLVSACLLFLRKLSVPKTILIAMGLGLLLGGGFR